MVATAQANGLNEQFVEKDYYVTEVLRIVAEAYGAKVIFKGGTSLSKGWALIDRFSEDVDLFVDPARFNPPLQGARAIDRELRTLRDLVAGHPGLDLVPELRQTIGGRGRADHLAYVTRFDALPGVASTVRLEPGVQSGDHPVERRTIESLIAVFLREQDQTDVAEDLEPFEMTLLHFRRTFVEKLFTIHSKVMRLLEDGTPVARDARHYADLHALASRPEVLAMLQSDEYREIRDDYDELSSQWFPRGHRPPAGLSFRQSPALFPPAQLREQLAADYASQCELLFPGDFPSFAAVLGSFERLREWL
ncbi:MAG: nucleotidyl transferase AbiEii/AbiGii toxin family protein [Actinobacteria bacterium]|nr:nucleotidyl transferase AbiEii/AbiGii toxin family protein [Actinomycetota bacterium]